jgi:tRNA(Arg) A34 adenosine deaminase TadA
MDPLTIAICLPEWINDELARQDDVFPTPESRMGLVVTLSRRNVLEGTGGPFGAGIFERESGRLVAPGVNVVLASNTSLAHAESTAFMLAQQRLETFDLGADGLPELELVASSQPCIQCFGNTWWSGVRALVIGARAEDVETITGFAEGPLPPDWISLLENRPAPLRPISVTCDILRAEARAVLELYRDSNGFIYNAGSA